LILFVHRFSLWNRVKPALVKGVTPAQPIQANQASSHYSVALDRTYGITGAAWMKTAAHSQ